MKITKIETIVVTMPMIIEGNVVPKASGAARTSMDTLLVKIETDEGVTGWGEGFGHRIFTATKAALDSFIAPMCIGRDPTQLSALVDELQRNFGGVGRNGPAMYALSAIDIALWDIAGKVARQPLHQLLGGGKPQLTCYASMIRYTDPKVVAANVERALGQGFRHMKLHEIEVAPTRAARDAAGESVDIMLDVNCPWTLREALDMAQKLRPLNLRWLEEPVWPPEDHSSLAQIRARGGIPIAAGENATTVAQFKHLFDAGAVDFVQPSPAKMGGVSELRKVFTLAAAYNVTVMPHSFYDGPAFLAGVHVNAALGRDSMVEWRFFDLEARLYGNQAIPQNGSIAVPQAPGLGFDPDPEIIRRYRAD